MIVSMDDQQSMLARPESPYCLDCQDEIDRKYGNARRDRPS